MGSRSRAPRLECALTKSYEEEHATEAIRNANRSCTDSCRGTVETNVRTKATKSGEQSYARRRSRWNSTRTQDQIRSQEPSICLRTRRATTLPGRGPARSANAPFRALRSSSVNLQTPELALDVISS